MGYAGSCPFQLKFDAKMASTVDTVSLNWSRNTPWEQLGYAGSYPFQLTFDAKMASTADTVSLNLRQDSLNGLRLPLQDVLCSDQYFSPALQSAAANRLENAWSLITSPTLHRHMTALNYKHDAGRQNNAGTAKVQIGPSVTLG